MDLRPPLSIIDEPAHDNGWYVIDAAGHVVEIEALVAAFNNLPRDGGGADG